MSLEGQEVWKRILQWGGQKTRSYTLQLREHNKRKENEKSKMRRREINRGKVKRAWKAGYSKYMPRILFICLRGDADLT